MAFLARFSGYARARKGVWRMAAVVVGWGLGIGATVLIVLWLVMALLKDKEERR